LQDRRLQTIHHRLPGGATLSKFDPSTGLGVALSSSKGDDTYDTVGNILTWQQQAGSAAPERWRYGYDRADQLTGAVKETTDPTPTVVQRLAYGYDPAGNRVFEQIDDGVTAWSHDALNRLVAQAGGGVLQVVGTVNEPATVTIQGKAATVSAANQFTGGVPVVPGTNVFTIRATDPSGNAATATYEVDVTDAPKTFTYDANGNLTSDGTRSFAWDARNQLVAVTVGTHRSEFSYDGLQRRVRQIEKENGVTQSDSKLVWCKDEICEERAADGITVTRRPLSRGEQRSGVARLFTTDHLGSVTEVTDVSAAALVRYELDPWGRRVVTAGAAATDVGFTGHDVHHAGGVLLAQYRAYDPELGRWLSSDPLGDVEGPNRYAYVGNRPLSMRDMLGLQGMNTAEAWLCMTNPFDCAKVKGCRDDAYNATVRKFGRQGHNDTSDASRHCYWSCCMAQKIGVEEAKRFGDAHENFPNNDPCERDMDFYNNDVGRRVGSSSPKGNCAELCNPKDLMCEKPKKCKL
jgi:RHS repeat-associated protein